jgi:hypothetical protein
VPSSKAAPEVVGNETLIRLSVQPMAAPKPALKYLLLPDLKEITPGNPIPAYLQCVVDHESSGASPDRVNEAVLRRVDQAARLEKPDWQLLLKAKSEGISLLLPDVQKMRVLALGLQERFRTELAKGRFDDAIVTAKTMFALARHMSENPTLISDLVGIAIANMGIVPLEEMLERPGCPNLYWALTNLPNPLVSLEKGLESDRLMLDAELKGLTAAAVMTPGEVRTVLQHFDKLGAELGLTDKTKARRFVERQAKDEVGVSEARKRLIEYGVEESLVQKFPNEQVILLDGKRDFETERDEAIKLMSLPAWEFAEMYKKLPPEKPKDDSIYGFLRMFQSAYNKIRFSQARLEQRIAMLRQIEAVRLYAADHQGRPPAKLADCAVPQPNDPFTGKPFRYSVENGVLHLRGTPPDGFETVAAYNLHYEITLK